MLKKRTQGILKAAKLYRTLDAPRSQKTLRKSVAENIRYRRKQMGKGAHTTSVINGLHPTIRKRYV